MAMPVPTPVQRPNAAPGAPNAGGTPPPTAPRPPAVTPPAVARPGVPSPGASVASPAAPPAAAAPPPAAPAPAPAVANPTYVEQMTAKFGGIGDPELDAALKGQVMQQLSDNPFSDEVRSRADTSAFEQGMADLKGTRSATDADLMRRGMFGTGLAGELGQEAEMSARASVAEKQRSNMVEFKKLGAEQKQQAIASAQTLASDLARRGIDIESLKMQREQMEASRGGGGGGGRADDTIEITNPDGSVSTVPLNILDLVLGMEEGGLE